MVRTTVMPLTRSSLNVSRFTTDSPLSTYGWQTAVAQSSVISQRSISKQCLFGAAPVTIASTTSEHRDIRTPEGPLFKRQAEENSTRRQRTLHHPSRSIDVPLHRPPQQQLHNNKDFGQRPAQRTSDTSSLEFSRFTFSWSSAPSITNRGLHRDHRH